MAVRRKTRWQKAKEDSIGFQWIREITLALSAGALCWLLLPETQAMEEIAAITIAAVTAILIVPSVELAWNFIRAPIRILREENVELRAQIEQYKAAEGIQEKDVNGSIIRGRYYGKKFVLDDPQEEFIKDFKDHETITLTTSCPPNTLGHFCYELYALDPFYVMTSGGEIAQMISGKAGILEIRVNEQSQVDIWPHGSGGRVRFDLLAWTEAGR